MEHPTAEAYLVPVISVIIALRGRYEVRRVHVQGLGHGTEYDLSKRDFVALIMPF